MTAFDPAAPYPRDLAGHGAVPPHPRWPGDAAIAVQLVVNVEEGGENSVLHGDGASEAFLSEIVGAAPWPGRRHMNMESIYEFGARAGFWRLHRLFTSRRGLPGDRRSASPPPWHACRRRSPPCARPAGRSPPTG